MRAGDLREQRAHAAPYRLEKRLRTQDRETEMNEGEEPIDDNEQDHHVDCIRSPIRISAAS